MLLCILSGAHADPLPRQQQIEILNQALRAFDRGAQNRQSNSAEAVTAFRESAAKFEALVDSGVRNGRLYYNLANAHLEAGDLGKAILNYRRAERLIPGDPRLVENLRYARTLCRDQIPASGQRAFYKTLFFWHYTTSLRTRYLLTIGAYVLFWLILLAKAWMPRVPWWYALTPLLVLWVSVGTSVVIELASRPHEQAGVILAAEVTVRKGNGEGFEPQFEQKLHEGVEFNLLEHRADWLRIELPDGKTGWIRTRDAGLI